MGVWVELSSVLYDIIEWEMCIYDLRQRDLFWDVISIYAYTEHNTALTTEDFRSFDLHMY